MSNKKILIILPYIGHVASLKEALYSIMRADEHYKYWRLAFHDDSAYADGKSIVKECFTDDLLKNVTFYRTVAMKQSKFHVNGMMGHVFNQIIKDHENLDIAMILPNDNRLSDHCLLDTSGIFTTYPKEMACYCHFAFTNSRNTIVYDDKHILNSFTSGINPYGKIDIGQLIWRINLNLFLNCWFEYPSDDYFDKFCKEIYISSGEIQYSGFIGQHKPEADKDLASRYFKQGIVYLNAKNYVEAERCFDRVLEIDPTNQEVLNYNKK